MRKIRNILQDREAYHVEAGDTVRAVVDYMCERKIGAVAVKDGDEVAGVFSERDLTRRVVHKGLDVDTVKVGEVMTKECMHIALDQDYRLAKAQMLDRHVWHLAVMDEGDEFHGILSMRDLIQVDVAEYAELVERLNDKYYQSAVARVAERSASRETQ